MKTIGIIGFGSFGKFLAENLNEYCKVLVYSKSGKVPTRWAVSVAEVTKCDYLMLAIPLDAYKQVLEQLKPYLDKNTVIVDVCSVKQKPLQIIKSILPKQPLVATHPLFGPESAAGSLRGHTLVLCPEDSDKTALKTIKSFVINTLHLRVIEISTTQHDREMAKVHGLTFFIARLLKELNLRSTDLDTPSFKRLLGLAELEKRHSDELFNTIQSGNKYTKLLRQKYIKKAIDLDIKINSNKL